MEWQACMQPGDISHWRSISTQLLEVARRLGLEGAGLPLLLPGAAHPYLPFAPQLSREDEQVGWQLALLTPCFSTDASHSCPPGSLPGRFSATT